ncbi:MAG: putative RNA uridine N3 methyltransferase [Thermoproteota archaeon]
MIEVRAREHPISIAFPSSVIYPLDNLMLATIRLGYIARAAAIFRIDKIIVYNEKDNETYRRLQEISYEILDYLSYPQYLRKIKFRMKPYLRYVGVLPPLKTPSHLVARNLGEVKLGDVREGIITKVSGSRAEVELGLGQKFFLKLDASKGGSSKVGVGQRMLFKLKDIRNFEVEIADEQPKTFWCYKVEKATSSLGSLLRSSKASFRVGTSRLGMPFYKAKDAIRKGYEKKGILIAFGGPKRGLKEILLEEKINLYEVFDVVVNTAKDQGVATIRTEEAILISLAVINEII